jgi:hypothetical protein
MQTIFQLTACHKTLFFLKCFLRKLRYKIRAAGWIDRDQVQAQRSTTPPRGHVMWAPPQHGLGHSSRSNYAPVSLRSLSLSSSSPFPRLVLPPNCRREPPDPSPASRRARQVSRGVNQFPILPRDSTPARAISRGDLRPRGSVASI